MKLRTAISSIILSGLALHGVQASESDSEITTLERQNYTAIKNEAPADLSYLSVNQNRRLSLEQGISIDTLLPQMNISGDTYLDGFTRMNEDEQQVALGLQMGDTHFNVMAGQGLSFSRVKNQYADIDPFYFHGGTTAEYQFNSVEVSHQFGSSGHLQIGQAVVQADLLEDRTTHYLGGQLGGLRTHYMQINRAGDKAGEALNLGFESSFGIADWSMLKQVAGGEIQQFSFSFNTLSPNQYHLALSSRRNPLIDDEENYRMMLGFRRALGGVRMGVEAAKEETESSNGTMSKRTPLIIGGVAVTTALVLSSGSDSQDNNSRLSDQHDAGRTALNKINPTSVRQNREYGGWVYKASDGRYTYTDSVAGGVASVNIPTSLIPPGGRPLASYHTHGGADPRYLNEQFSPADYTSDNEFNVDGYLGTPAGNFLWHESGTRKGVRLGSIAR